MTDRHWKDAYDKSAIIMQSTGFPDANCTKANDGESLPSVEYLKEYDRQMRIQDWPTFDKFLSQTCSHCFTFKFDL